MTVYLTPASSAALARATQITGDNRTDTINRALQAYALMAGQVDGGSRVVIHRGGESTAPGSDLVIWHAGYEADEMLGCYITRDAAMDHVHHVLAAEENTTAEAIQARVTWRADDPRGSEPTPWECWLFDGDDGDDTPTGYVVTPLPVVAAYGGPAPDATLDDARAQQSADKLRRFLGGEAL